MTKDIRVTDKKKPGGITGIEAFTIEDSDKKLWDVTLQEIADLLPITPDFVLTDGRGTTANGTAVDLEKTYDTLTSAATLNLDVNLNQNIILTLGENVTLTLINLFNGAEGNIVVIQDAANYTLDLIPTPYVISGGAGITALEPGAGSITVLSYSYDGTRLLVNSGLNYTNA